ncbi:MAG: glutathione S-transferase N-terminal domain-containing protein [Gammaproteobacteria bacterium]|nr:glutathione S-transferase N-terminal domain-containing protein [Gammaproteobacteria bacterium]MDH3466383.1 glutathione S-transferase N-terminal domain-containing protein [Gammaproteobacteria bacterium]
MYHIHGANVSSNITKTVYVAEELGIDFKYTNLDLSKGEHKSPEHLARHPLGKIPTLTHDGETLFESGAFVDISQA